MAEATKTFRGPWNRLLLVVSACLVGSFGLRGVLEIVTSDGEGPLAAVSLTLAAGALVMALLAGRALVRLHPDHLVVRRGLRDVVVPYADVLDVRTDREDVRWSTALLLDLRDGRVQTVVAADLTALRHELVARVARVPRPEQSG